MQNRILKGHYRTESGALEQGKLLITNDGGQFGDEYGNRIDATHYKAAEGVDAIEITGPMVGWRFVPDAGECERVGMEVK